MTARSLLPILFLAGACLTPRPLRGEPFPATLPPPGGASFWLTAPGGIDLPDSVRGAALDMGNRSLLVESRVYYLRGLSALGTGGNVAARRSFEIASVMDPTYPEPHFAAAWAVASADPGAAIGETAEGIRTMLQDFPHQHALVVNALVVTYGVLLLTGLLAALAMLAAKGKHLQHVLFEFLAKKLPRPSASLVGWGLLIQPVFWGIGLYQVCVAGLGLLWRHLSGGERRAAVAILSLAVLTPAFFMVLSPLLAPLDPRSAPSILAMAQGSGANPAVEAELTRLIERHPGIPSLHFSRALLEKRSGRLDAALADLKQASDRGGNRAKILNNEANVLFIQGKVEEAMKRYRDSIGLDPENAAPHFNLAQAYTRRLMFDRADDEMREANRLDFDRVQAALKDRSDHMNRALMDAEMSPSEIWPLVWASGRGAKPVGAPSYLRWIFPLPAFLLPVAAILLFGIGSLAGSRLFAALPTFACTNCGAAACRKCLKRLTRKVYCGPCGETLLSMNSGEYVRILLEKRRSEGVRGLAIFRKALRIAIPGFRQFLQGRMVLGAIFAGIFFLSLVSPVFRGLPIRTLPAVAADGFARSLNVLSYAGILLAYLGSILLPAPSRREEESAEAEPRRAAA